MRISILLILLIFSSTFKKEKSRSGGFTKIEYASFDVNSYRTPVKDSVFIDLYSSISPDGLIKINNPGDLQGSPKVYYSFQLAPEELKLINSIFNNSTPLKTYLIKTKLENNSMYAGSYNFYRVTYSNGIVDSICIIDPFASESFQNISNLFSNIYYARKNRTKLNKFEIPSDFFLSLKNDYWKSKYLPEIKNPPPFISQ